MLSEEHHLQLSSTCGKFPNKAPSQPLPAPRKEGASDEAAGNAKGRLGKSLELFKLLKPCLPLLRVFQ